MRDQSSPYGRRTTLSVLLLTKHTTSLLDVKYITRLSYEDQLKAIRYKPYLIRGIQNPSEKMQRFAIRHNAVSAIVNIENPSDDIKLYAIRFNSEVMLLYPEAVLDFKLKAIRLNPLAILYISNYEDNDELLIAKLTYDN